MWLRLFASLVLSGLVLTACGSSEKIGPPEINYGRDVCIECGMIIDDPRFAATYRLDDGTEKVFDDLGGLIIRGRETDELESAAVWVSDFDEETLIDATTAFFVPTVGVTSPMGHGILAFEDENRAQVIAMDLGGEVIRWDTVVELEVVDGLLGSHHDQ